MTYPLDILIVVLALVYLSHRLSRLHEQNQALAWRLDKLLEHHGIQTGIALEPSAKVKELARTPGAGLEAIRAYRAQTGLGLKEAQAVVQSLEREAADDARPR